MTGKIPRVGPKLFGCRAAFVETPGLGDAPLAVCITFPNGTSVRSDDPDLHATLSGYLGRSVTLERAVLHHKASSSPSSISPCVRADELHPRPAQRPPSREPFRRAAFSHERHREHRKDRVRGNGWTGHGLRLGDSARLDVVMPDPRCVMTTLAQEGLPKDPEVLRTLARENRLEVAGGRYPCAGVYAAVASAGTIRNGGFVALK